jgi:hypothetical protein
MRTTESLFAEGINDFCNEIGTKRTYRDACPFVCFRGEANMHGRVASTKWIADDPFRPFALPKSKLNCIQHFSLCNYFGTRPFTALARALQVMPRGIRR